jgi:mycothiol synthase
VRWNSWNLELPPGAEILERTLPEGYALRQAEASDVEKVWQVIEGAFAEWANRAITPLADWLVDVTERDGFEPWMVRVVTDPHGVIVGAAHVLLASEGTEGYVARLAVDASHRNRGLAQALLSDAFTVAREHGATRSTLNTDSRTGALGLYEKVGMVVTRDWISRATAL